MTTVTLANVVVGGSLAGVLVVLLAVEFVHRPLLRSRRPQLPPEDRPPAGLPARVPIAPHEVAAEVDRGYAALVSYLRRRSRHA